MQKGCTRMICTKEIVAQKAKELQNVVLSKNLAKQYAQWCINSFNNQKASIPTYDKLTREYLLALVKQYTNTMTRTAQNTEIFKERIICLCDRCVKEGGDWYIDVSFSAPLDVSIDMYVGDWIQCVAYGQYVRTRQNARSYQALLKLGRYNIPMSFGFGSFKFTDQLLVHHGTVYYTAYATMRVKNIDDLQTLFYTNE